MSRDFRNIAIIAHIDHGKTTLLDAMLRHSKVFQDHEEIPERAMDSYDQEKERGITIFSKHTSFTYKDTKINVIDTPGHADFSGEVERVLGMVSSVLLIVDAQDGPMPQTRFVLSKALKMGLCPIVVINKLDRPNANPERALNLTFDLFVELGANEKQLDFAYCYASALNGYAVMDPKDPRESLQPLLELILAKVEAPLGDSSAPFLMQASNIEYDQFVGRLAMGIIRNGTVKKGQRVLWMSHSGEEKEVLVTKIEGVRGLKKVELTEAVAGDIVSIAAAPEIRLGDCLCELNHPELLPPLQIDEPTLSIDVMINSSPFAGKDGKNVTFSKIKERLFREKRSNISLRIEESPYRSEAMTVYGRGELQLGVLLEAMRREGLEMSISQPQVIVKIEDGIKKEPMERVYIETPEEFSGTIIEQLSQRKAELQLLETSETGIVSMEFLAPTRGMLGYRGEFLTATRGLGILTSLFDSFQPWKGEILQRARGVLISMTQGKATAYAIGAIQKRATLFISPGDEIYEGMVVGENSRDNDLVVNLTKGKQLTNVRAAGSDEMILIIPARRFSLEQLIAFISQDELLEITPHYLRIRKQFLTESERKKQK